MRTWTQAAAPDRENEDAVATFPGGAVLADGAGLPAALRAGCRHSVAWYSTSLADLVAARATDPRTALTDAVRGAIAQVSASHDGCTLAGGSPSATLAAVRVEGDRLHHLALADSSILLVRDDDVVHVCDDRIDRTVAPMAAALLARWRETGEYTGEAAHLESYRRTGERLRNTPGGFWVAHTDPAAADEALTGSTPLAGVRAVVLASDGAMCGARLLGLHSVDDAARAFVAGRADAVLAQIRDAESARAEELALDRTKTHDDMTVLVLDPDDLRP